MMKLKSLSIMLDFIAMGIAFASYKVNARVIVKEKKPKKMEDNSLKCLCANRNCNRLGISS
jgi:hypothetical protein